MQRQLPFGQKQKDGTCGKVSTPRRQRTVIAILSRLIGKAVRPRTREENNER